MNEQKITCASCKYFGNKYWYNGSIYSHSCLKSKERRAENMPKNADFMDHFRAFFDATADQGVCHYYEERPIAKPEVIKLLGDMAESKGRGEFKFFSEENRLAGEIDEKFIDGDMHALKKEPGNRVYHLLPAGKYELARVLKAGMQP